MKENLPKTAKSAQPESERDDLSECSETSDASLSGDSLNSGFREPSKSPVSSKNYLISSEDLSVASGSSVITSSTAIKEMEDYDDEDEDDNDYVEEDEDDATTQDDDSRLSTDLDAELYSVDESEHPSLEEYIQLSSQVAKKLSERTVPAFSTESPKEKNVISQFMKEFKTTMNKLKSAEDSNKPRSERTSPPGADNWTLKKEDKKTKVTRKVSIFKRNPLKGRKSEELLVTDESEKNGVYYDNTSVTETEDAASSRSSSSSVNSKKGKQKFKNKPPEIIPAAKVIDVGDKTIISITNANQNGVTDPR